MSKKFCSLFFLIFCVCPSSNAQQIFRLSQYLQHNYIFNPAASGAGAFGSAIVSYKKMWSGIEGGPQTLLASTDKYFKKYKTGFSSVLFNDVTGPTSRSGIEMNGSYALPMTEKRKLMFGMGALLLQERVDKNFLEKYIPGDPLLSGSGSVVTGDASAGIYYTSPKFNVGLSVKQLIQSKLNLIKSSTTIEGKLYRQYYFMGSYNLITDEENVIVPNFLVKISQNAPTDIEAGAKIIHKDMIWGGFNFHYDQDYTAFAGLKINGKYSIGYAFDQYKTPLSVFDDGGNSHELSLMYYFQK